MLLTHWLILKVAPRSVVSALGTRKPDPYSTNEAYLPQMESDRTQYGDLNH